MRSAVLVFFALLPLQWVALGGTPLGQARLHQVAILLLAVALLGRHRLPWYAPVLGTSAVFVIANLYMIATIAAVQAYNGLGLQAAIQQLVYLVAFLALAAFVYEIASGRAEHLRRTLRYAALVLSVSFMLGLSVAMAVNGVNFVAVVGQTIATADPEVFQKEVYKSAFAGFGLGDELIQGSLRHEIFGSVLVSMLISTWAMRSGSRPSTTDRRAYGAAMVLGTCLLVVSLSRSILIAAMVWPLLAALRSARRRELTPRQIAILGGTALAMAALFVSGLGQVIYNRFFTDTTGYEARAGNYGDAYSALADVWVTGGYETAGASSHNFVVDTLLRHGIFAAVPAAIILVVLLVGFVLLASRLHRMPASMVPVVAALAPPLVRLGTSGGGLIPPIEWVALAFVVGVLTDRRQRADELLSAPGGQSRPRQAASRGRTEPSLRIDG